MPKDSMCPWCLSGVAVVFDLLVRPFDSFVSDGWLADCWLARRHVSLPAADDEG